MFYDLNVPWTANDIQLPRKLAFLHELGYSVVALNYTLSGKLPTDLTCPIPDPLPSKDVPPKLTVLRRCTLVLTESYQNARLAELSRNYDMLAVRPIDEQTLSLAYGSLDCDIISLDLTQRLPYWFKHKTLSEAIKSGKKFEISYAQGVMGDSGMRRNLISNATQLIRASRGRGLIISSEARNAVGCRGPWDAINLAAIWGLGQEKGYEALSKECRSVVVTAKLKRTSYRGVIDVVYGGEKPPAPTESEMKDAQKGKGRQPANGLKRKADSLDASGSSTPYDGDNADQRLSKRAMKRLAHQARLKAASERQDAQIGAVMAGEPTVETPNEAKESEPNATP